MNSATWQQQYPDLIDSQYHWFIPNQQTDNPSKLWLDWLLDSGSLTSRLQQLSEGQFEVDVLEEGFFSADKDQCIAFNLTEQDKVWSRRVILKGNSESWVAAHTIIPMFALKGELKKVLDLNGKPLGELLFSESTMRREAIFICKTHTGWGRRSKFYLFDQPLVVAEYFLDAFINKVTGVE